jgi:hypothetical protein
LSHSPPVNVIVAFDRRRARSARKLTRATLAGLRALMNETVAIGAAPGVSSIGRP